MKPSLVPDPGRGVLFNVPSVQFEYSNLGYALLGNIVSRVAGMPYQDYIRQNILLPLGMEHTYWEYADVPEGQLVSGYRWEDEQWKDEPMLHDGYTAPWAVPDHHDRGLQQVRPLAFVGMVLYPERGG
ncbi:MAG: serine hydrolase [Lewinellaceae bacterium]|nr:serine hydrolase [Lewinellaceae bacterium]